jgi:hypothetical protein
VGMFFGIYSRSAPVRLAPAWLDGAAILKLLVQVRMLGPILYGRRLKPIRFSPVKMGRQPVCHRPKYLRRNEARGGGTGSSS